MPNKRDPNKIKVQTWLSKADKAALEKVAKEKGIPDCTKKRTTRNAVQRVEPTSVPAFL